MRHQTDRDGAIYGAPVMTASGQSVQRLSPWFLILFLLSGFFTRAGELPRLPNLHPRGAFTIGRSVLGGCDGLGGPPEKSTPTQRMLTMWGNLLYFVREIPPPYGS